MLTHAKGSEVQIVCGKHEADELESKLGYAGPVGLRAQAGELRWRRRTLRTAVVFSCGHNGLVEWLMEHFGRYAHGKRLPAWALTMPEPWRRAMLEGYISADGNIGRRTRISTVSKALAVGIRLLASSLGHTASLEALSSRGGQIEGRSIRTRPGWAVSWTTSPVYPHGTRIGQHHWSPVRQVHPGQQGVEVYNLAVAEDESYVADGIVVHNCTAHSYANGVSRKLARRTLFEQPDPAAERSRATMWDVVRFMEAHRYQAVIVENVVNVRDWELFEPWLHAVRSVRPGYEAETVYLNSMVAWPTPQSRDRLYTVIWRKGAPRPRLRFDAPAWCPTCQAVVTGVQSWKNPRRPWGRYAQQYWYRCPACTQITWPLVYPAATAIDWSLKAPRIGDRAKPLAANTIARIQAGLRRYAAQPVPMLVRVAGHTFQREGSTCRVRPVHQPFRAQTGTLADALVIPVNGHVADQGCTGRRARRVAEPLATLTADKALALILSARGTDHNDADHRTRPVSDPLPTQGASKTMALLVTAGGSWQGASPASDPAPTQTAREAWGLLVPTEARAGLRARPADEPMRTQTTRAELGLAMLPIVVEARRNATGRAVDEPLGCVTAKGNHHYLAVPPGFLVANYGDGTDPHKNGWVHGVDQPTGSITTKDHHALLVPYNRTGNPRRPSEPLRTVTTHDREALIDLAERVEDCGFRMLQPAEIQAAMAFRDGYVVLGNKREKVAQLGNAVTPPVMRLLMHRVLESLEGAA
jgi:DNA (cytosine-5)-methyltransferase 1